MRSFLYCAAVVFAMREDTSDTSNGTPDKIVQDDEEVKPKAVPEVKTGNLPQQLTVPELKVLSKLTDENFFALRQVDTDHLKEVKESYLEIDESTFNIVSDLVALPALKKLDLAMVTALQKLTKTGYERMQAFNSTKDYVLAEITGFGRVPGYQNGSAWKKDNGWEDFGTADYAAINKLQRETLEAMSFEVLMSVTEATLKDAHKLVGGSSLEKANFVLNGCRFREPAAVEVLLRLDAAASRELNVFSVKTYIALKNELAEALKKAGEEKTELDKKVTELNKKVTELNKKVTELNKFKLVNWVLAFLLVAALVACVVLAVQVCKKGKEEVVKSEV